MKNKINKIIKLIENLEISGSSWDESSVFSPILEIILKKQNFKYEEPYQFYHQIHDNLYKNCQTCKSKCKTSYKTH
ncbi:hypothetical protein [Spiroplasma poulsonii]|uniref:Uncharacterized protein n=1 Tax=Spiroplasma poulsonii TaxID=2138 RepID=A0A2P6FDH3_9MOLU|nr:hypothetical protein [Spiroplasma poulsonii]KAF0850884.1 hypothetical protein MSROBK_013650 [Spiroplasma poulsonii]PQM31507.1 hypothetical protein SMSRO_SF013420 [Spiroplasma poulsonii]PWF96522.1 hypothetical protein SMSE_19690 [Spiroplasma poulsonii]PWF97098.1 hypothetical protein SMH99_19070 [Spiroplasma poulsonii]